MPVKSSENLEMENGIQQFESIPQLPEQQPVFEITLTDKLNKRLLQSFLSRINNFEHHFNKINGDTTSSTDGENEFN